MKVRRAWLVGLLWVGCGSARGPSPECQAYLECYKKTGGSTNDASYYYGESPCWTGDPQVADSCTAACKSAIASLKSAYPDAGCGEQRPPPRTDYCDGAFRWLCDLAGARDGGR